MSAAHLSEHENWPGEGTAPTGRTPTPYLLSLFAAVYGCAVHDLLDAADYEHMAAADRLILDKTAHTDVGQPAGGIVLRAAEEIAPEEIAGRPSVHRLVRELITSAPPTIRRDAAHFATRIGVSR